MGKYMMATKAEHKLGDISRDEADLCFIKEETDEYYIGHWVTGFGFIGVHFPKATTRILTPEEIAQFNDTYIQIGSCPPVKLNVKKQTEAPQTKITVEGNHPVNKRLDCVFNLDKPNAEHYEECLYLIIECAKAGYAFDIKRSEPDKVN